MSEADKRQQDLQAQRIQQLEAQLAEMKEAHQKVVDAIIEEHAALEEKHLQRHRELEDKLALIRDQQEIIRELSTPVLEIWDETLVLPVIGALDTRRSVDIMDSLLRQITELQARCVILDVTGVAVVDTSTASYLTKVARASNLLGARCVLTGVSPAVAQTLVEIGADLGGVICKRNLKEGLKDCLRFLNRSQQ